MGGSGSFVKVVLKDMSSLDSASRACQLVSHLTKTTSSLGLRGPTTGKVMRYAFDELMFFPSKSSFSHLNSSQGCYSWPVPLRMLWSTKHWNRPKAHLRTSLRTVTWVCRQKTLTYRYFNSLFLFCKFHYTGIGY